MKISIISFTKRGLQLSLQLKKCMKQYEMQLFTKCSAESENSCFIKESLGEWTKTQLLEKKTLIFIGACGIAVRAIAPYVKDKLSDTPVLVIDELGNYVIPLLAGHVGGANSLAIEFAGQIHAQAVITTATDINHCFAVDVFAKKNHLEIENKDGIAKVSAKILNGNVIQVSVDEKRVEKENGCPKEVEIVPYPPRDFVDVVITEEAVAFDASLVLRAKPYVVGMGCRKGKEEVALCMFLEQILEHQQIDIGQVAGIASVEQKKNEPGLVRLAKEKQLPFLTYRPEELSEIKGDFTSSHFVKQTIGVDNVCERAALNACGEKGMLLLKKQAKDGMTIAVAKKDWRIAFDEA